MGKNTEKRSRAKVLISVSLIVGILIGYFIPDIVSYLSRSKIEKDIVKLYELANPGTMISVESVKDMGDIYRVLLKVVSNRGTNYQEVFVTKDGKYLTTSIIFVKESIKSISSLKNFVECLNSKGVRIYGITNSTQSPQGASATLLQLNILGRYSIQLYVPCDGQFVNNCLNAGVTQVPSVVYKGKVYSGVYSIPWFENLTGCKLE